MNRLLHLASSPQLATLGLNVLLQVTAVVVVAGFMARAAFRRHAAAQHVLWLGALAWVLLSPAVAVIAERAGFSIWALRLPVLRIAVSHSPDRAIPRGDLPTQPSGSFDDRARATNAAAVDPETPRQLPTTERIDGTVVAVRSAESETSGVRDRASRWRTLWIALPGIAAAAWLAGILIGFVRIVVGYRRVTSLISSAQPLDAARYADASIQARAVLRIAELPEVVLSPLVGGPVATGVIRPRIVLPTGLAETLSASALRDVLIHEGAHILRRDPWIGLLQRVAAVLVWPHPLVHYLNGQLARAREEVCDNYVLGQGDPCGYARTLVALTELCRPLARVAQRLVCWRARGRWQTASPHSWIQGERR